MSKFEYNAFEGWEQLSKFVNLYKETTKIKQIKLDKTIGQKTKNLNINPESTDTEIKVITN